VKSKAACQLLTAIDDGQEAAARLLDQNYAVQQKFDGKRILLHIERHSVTAHNRDGLTCEISKNIVTEAKRFSLIAPLLIDSEWIRETKTLYAFDLLEINGVDLRPTSFVNRIAQLAATIQAGQTSVIRAARTELEQHGKIDLLTQIHNLNLEGIALKKKNSPYRIDRQPDQFKYKFTHVASFLVTQRNQKASVDLGLFNDAGKLIEVGSVKIRDKRFERISEGMIIDVRYSHAFQDSNHIYQPRMERLRDDVQPEGCLLSQLRYKAANPIAI
jgi:ATP-dependent DNA ligase